MSWLGGSAAHLDCDEVAADGSDEGIDVVVVVWWMWLLLLLHREVRRVGEKSLSYADFFRGNVVWRVTLCGN